MPYSIDTYTNPKHKCFLTLMRSSGVSQHGIKVYREKLLWIVSAGWNIGGPSDSEAFNALVKRVEMGERSLLDCHEAAKHLRGLALAEFLYCFGIKVPKSDVRVIHAAGVA